jgi:hypothetical protein
LNCCNPDSVSAELAQRTMPLGCKLGEAKTTASHLLVVVLSRHPSPAFHLWAVQGVAAWLIAFEEARIIKNTSAVVRNLLKGENLGRNPPVSFEYIVFIEMFYSLIRVSAYGLIGRVSPLLKHSDILTDNTCKRKCP